MPYARGRDASHAMTRISRTLRELELKGYTTEAVTVWASTPDDNGHTWSALATLQNPDTDVPAQDSPAVVTGVVSDE